MMVVMMTLMMVVMVMVMMVVMMTLMLMVIDNLIEYDLDDEYYDQWPWKDTSYNSATFYNSVFIFEIDHVNE